ncbi:hypothetical protein IMZ48_45170 [Candidatus Bathyarchaeota archaeon]|nr:hypothetical protein [Candidatus Bathyarchaeota archaeon]
MDTAVIRLPIWVLRSTFGRLIPSKKSDDDEIEVEQTDDASDSDLPQHTPSTGSDVGDFEVVEKSTESLNMAKTTGSQAQNGGKKRRSNKKR